jgi:hypothetical protein
LNRTKKASAIGLIRKYLNLNMSDEQIIDIIEGLKRRGLIELTYTKEKESLIEIYVHTSKVESEMLNDALRFKRKFGWSFFKSDSFNNKDNNNSNSSAQSWEDKWE